MTYASRILHHSQKFRHAQNVLRNDRVILMRWFTDNARSSVDKIDEVSRSRQLGLRSGDKCGVSMFSSVGCISTSNRTLNPTKELAMKMCKGNNIFARKMHGSAIGIKFNSRQRSSARSFSTDSGLPPHQEIGMPSLSLTMTEGRIIPILSQSSHSVHTTTILNATSITLMQGNIARWLKKEGDKVSTGEVLCEVETDKATVEMECMEEGYLAQILCGDGSSGIKVGKIIAITVEEEGDATKFKDYKPSTSDAVAAPKSQSARTTTDKENKEVPVASPEPEVSESATPSQAGDHVFASPIAKKLAEDNNVSLSNIKGTGPEGRIVKSDIEDNLDSHGKRVAEGPKVGKLISGALDYTDIPHTQIRKDADQKGLSKISDEVKHLAQKAKENSLKLEDYEGGTFTVSNLGGPVGIKQFLPSSIHHNQAFLQLVLLKRGLYLIPILTSINSHHSWL